MARKRLSSNPPGSSQRLPAGTFFRSDCRYAAGLLILVSAAVLVGCDLVQADRNASLRASGIVETTEVVVASDLGGRVVEVLVDEGDSVASGDPLFRLENEVLAAQETEVRARLIAAEAARENAQAAAAIAEPQVEAARIAIELARVQLEIQQARERQAAVNAGATAFNQPLPAEFFLPDWYFQPHEVLRSAEHAFQQAERELVEAQSEYDDLVAQIGAEALSEAESRLGEARIAFVVANDLASRDVGPNRQASMDEAAQEMLRDAEIELDDAQDAYDDLLTTGEFRELLEARARLALSRERWESTLDQLRIARVGALSLPVQAAQLALQQAELALAQAEAARTQAQSEVRQAEALVALAESAVGLTQSQIDQLTVPAAIDGVVFIRGIEPGEILLPGAPALVLGGMDRLTVTVFIPEDRYGSISLNDTARIEVDSFPGEQFEASVSRIAEQAEFTPRNVQTEEERRTTVFAVELSLSNPAGKLKPGMPCTVSFE